MCLGLAVVALQYLVVNPALLESAKNSARTYCEAGEIIDPKLNQKLCDRLATAPEDKLRDGHRAVALATDACRQTEYKQDYILSTLAAAYAETGDFDSARKWAAQAVEAKPSAQAEPSRKDELK